jgi:N-acetylglucosamine-6-sulfatase
MFLTRRSLLFGGAASTAAQVRSRPNFVFILVDDLRYNALGCTGHPFAKTPRIDLIAREGVNFVNSFVTTSLCSPSRGCFLSGQYVHTHGIRDNTEHNAQSHQLITFPRLLHDAGYETAYVGKWHMGNDDTPRPGFDRWVSFRGQGVYVDPPLNVDGKPVQNSGYITDLLNGHAVDFLERKRTKPFCLYLAHKAVHGPFTPADRHLDLYAGETIVRKASATDTLEGKPVLRRALPAPPQQKAAGKKGAGKKAAGNGNQTGPGDAVILNQLRCLAAIDDGVGRIWDVLQQFGQLDNTVFVFTSDNGYLWGEHGLGDKRASYEESIRIPMLARYPGLIKPGSVAQPFALNIDIAPTFLELAGVRAPGGIQGHSLVPVMRGNAKGWRQSFLMEYFEEPQFPRIPTFQGVRGERWKYTRYPTLPEMDELYDLRNDPDELNNLYQSAAAGGALKSMRTELDRLLKETRG